MQTKLTGHHIDITDALRDYVNDKLERVERHHDGATSVHVVLSVEKLRQKAEATLHVAGNDLHAIAEEEDMYAAIDAMIDRLDRQIKKHKDKVNDKHRNEKTRDYHS